MDLATVDHLLTTTRSVRKRLDLSRPLEPELIERCLEIAIQAPSGSDRQGWHFVVITEPALKLGVAELYRKSYWAYAANRPSSVRAALASSSDYLAEHMHEAPALVCSATRAGPSSPPQPRRLASTARSCRLLGRSCWRCARGVGSAWTTLHLRYEQETAELLGLPPNLTQAVLLPIAYAQSCAGHERRRMSAPSNWRQP